MNIYIPRTLYELMPGIWFLLFFFSISMSVLAPNAVELVTALVSLYKGVVVSGKRAEARFMRGTW